MSTALVTGASGFIGQHVARGLACAGWHVRTLHRGAALSKFPDHVSARVEVDDLRKATQGVDAIVHLAGSGDVVAAANDPLGYNLVNAVGTLRVLEAGRTRGAPVLLASTQHVYRPSRGRLSERSAPRPQNVYGTSKLIAEQWCAMYGRTYALPTRVLRFFSVYGPGQMGQGTSGVVAIFTQRALRDESIKVMSNQQRDFTYVDDAVRGIMAALDRISPGFDLLNIGTGIGTSFPDLATTICKLTGSASLIDKSELRPTTTHLVANVEHARKVLDYQAQTSLIEGLQRYCDWTRQATLRSS